MEDPLKKYKDIYAGIFQKMRVTTGSEDADKYILMYRLAYHSMPMVRFGNYYRYKVYDKNGEDTGIRNSALHWHIDYVSKTLNIKPEFSAN
jgi:hypothetical protein